MRPTPMQPCPVFECNAPLVYVLMLDMKVCLGPRRHFWTGMDLHSGGEPVWSRG